MNIERIIAGVPPSYSEAQQLRAKNSGTITTEAVQPEDERRPGREHHHEQDKQSSENSKFEHYTEDAQTIQELLPTGASQPGKAVLDVLV